MGCDIHPYPEKLEDGEWVTAEPFVLSEWWHERIIDRDHGEDDRDYKIIEAEYTDLTKEEIMEKYGDDPLISFSGPWDNTYELRSRNYAWFAILADVRNGGWTDKSKEERGLPYDVSPEVERQSDFDGPDGHSHSWVSLRELQEFDWDAPTQEGSDTTLREAVGNDYLQGIIDRLATYGEPNEVRMVFWFDN